MRAPAPPRIYKTRAVFGRITQRESRLLNPRDASLVHTLVLAVQEHVTIGLIGFVVPIIMVFGATAGRDDRAIGAAPSISDEEHRNRPMRRGVLLGSLSGEAFWLGGGLVMIGFLVWLAAVMVQHFLADTTIANFDSTIARVAGEKNTHAMFYATWHTAMIGSPRVTAVVVVVTGLAMRLRMGTWRPLTILGLVYAGSVILEIALKMTIVREQPPAGWMTAVWGSSFPSGHSARAAGTYGACAHLIGELRREWRRRLWTAATLTALIVGISVVYLGMHWSTDVAGGWIVGSAWLGVVLSRLPRRISTNSRLHQNRQDLARPAAACAGAGRGLEPLSADMKNHRIANESGTD